MKKKVIGTSILLLILLLGCYGMSYADVNRDFTKADLQNYIYNTFKIRGFTDEQAETYTNIFSETELTEIATSLNSYDYVLVASTTSVIYLRASNTNNTTSGTTYLTTGDKQIINNNTSYYTYGKNLNINQNSSSLGTISNATSSTINLMKQSNSSLTNIYYSSYNIYRNTTGGNSIGTPPIYKPNSDIFSGNYVDRTPFSFIEEPTTEHGNVYEFENVPVYEKPRQNDLLLGFLTVPNEITITDFRIDRYYYQGGDWQQKVITYDQNNPYIFRNLYYTDQNQKAYNYYYKQENLYKDNIYYIRWGDTTTEPYQWAYCIFYIKSEGTTISGGMIHNPSGDPIQDIINNGNENDDFWKNVYRELFTLDSGESKEILDNFIENTNLGEVGTLSGELMMLNILKGEPTDFIISWETVYSPNVANSGTKQIIPSGEINFSKLTMRLGNQYEAPTNRQQVLEVINVVRIILGYTVLVLLTANLWETIMRVLGVGVGMYEDNEEEKQRLETSEETIYTVEGDTGQIYGRTVIRKEPRTKRKFYFKYKD